MKKFEIENGVLVRYNGTAEEVTIPDSVEKIGDNAFRRCKSIKVVAIPTSVKEIVGDDFWEVGAFSGCEALEQVILSVGLEKIDPYAFYECKSLKSITIPTSVKEIGKNAFWGCDSLVQVILSEGLVKIGKEAFSSSLKTITIPASVKQIECGAFGYYNRLNSAVFEGAAPKIGKDALGKVEVIYAPHASAAEFSQYKEAYFIGFLQLLKEGVSIDEAIIEKNKKNIKLNAQKLCETKNEELFAYMLRNALIPLKVVDELIAKYNEEKNVARVAALIDYKEKNFTEEQKEEQFNKQFEIREPTFAELRKVWTFSKKEDGTYRISAYKGEDIDMVIPSAINGIRVSEIGNGKSYYYANNNLFLGEHTQKVRTIILKDGIESITDFAFSHCELLKSITIPASVKEIGWGAFYNCESLESVMLPKGLETIGMDAFKYCKSLKTITIPVSVKKIEDGAFEKCSSLKEVKFLKGADGIDISPSAFAGCMGLKEENGFIFIGSLLVAYVGGAAEITIPNETKMIGSGAFAEKNITEISLPDSLEQIGSSAFANCKLLKVIKIPDSVKSIGGYAFGGCSDITIYVRCRKRPEGWDDDWNRNGWQGKKVKVVWGYKGD